MKNFKHHLCHYLAERQLEPYPEIKSMTLECYVYTSGLQLFVITMKSLRHDDKGIILDCERMKDELQLWTYYANDEPSEKDFYQIGMWPLVMTHADINNLHCSLRQYIEVLSIETALIPEIFFSAYCLREAMMSDDLSYIVESAKRLLIGLSFSELFQEYDQKKIIAFEKARIKILMGISSDWVQKMLDPTPYHASESTGFLSLLARFYDDLISIKSGRRKIPPYVKNRQKLYHLKPGETVHHGLLGETQMIYNLEVNQAKILVINTKYGCYRLRDKR